VKIQTKAQAAAVVQSMKTALDQLVVRGYDNCYIVAAIGGDLEAVAAFLSDEADSEEISGKEYEDH